MGRRVGHLDSRIGGAANRSRLVLADPMSMVSGWDRHEEDRRADQRREEEEGEARHHAEQQLEHDLSQAARFLLAHGTLGEVWQRIAALAMEIDYGKKEEAPF